MISKLHELWIVFIVTSYRRLRSCLSNVQHSAILLCLLVALSKQGPTFVFIITDMKEVNTFLSLSIKFIIIFLVAPYKSYNINPHRLNFAVLNKRYCAQWIYTVHILHTQRQIQFVQAQWTLYDGGKRFTNDGYFHSNNIYTNTTCMEFTT